jgi:phosphotransferase system IIA component
MFERKLASHLTNKSTLVSKRLMIIGLIIACACGSENNVTPSDQLYFPLQVGKYWIYDVEETSILRLNCNDNGEINSKYELLVSVTDSFPNPEGGYSYKMLRSTRITSSQVWNPVATWTSKIVKSQAINNESNVPYVKLIFPVFDGLQWNGNLFNNETQLNGKVEDQYKLTLTDQPFTSTKGQAFEQTVTVIQNDEQKNILYRDTRSEVYAFNVGLVYKESYLLTYFSNSQLPCYAQNKTQQGFIYKQTLKEFGKN